jgi:hypothetical protein
MDTRCGSSTLAGARALFSEAADCSGAATDFFSSFSALAGADAGDERYDLSLTVLKRRSTKPLVSKTRKVNMENENHIKPF